MKDDAMKMVVIESLKYLVDRKLVELYGYVIMPNHIHLLWTTLKENGKECASTSLTKFTAHQFKNMLSDKPDELMTYASGLNDRAYQFWKRDPLAIPITSHQIFLQKLDYIHNNPVRENWKLSETLEDYRFSSASFYYDSPDEFGILTNFIDAGKDVPASEDTRR
jgi:REP element-mobilizing transposase RayT